MGTSRKVPGAMPLPTPASPRDRTLNQAITDIYRVLQRRVDDEIQQGNEADKPVSTGAARFFFAMDSQTLWFDSLAGWVAIGGGGVGAPDFWVVETPAGSLDSVNTDFILSYLPRPADFPGDDSMHVLWVELNKGYLQEGLDYTVASNVISLTVAPDPGDNLQARYIANPGGIDYITTTTLIPVTDAGGNLLTL